MLRVLVCCVCLCLFLRLEPVAITYPSPRSPIRCCEPTAFARTPICAAPDCPVVTAYLMKHKGWALAQALAEVRRAQPTVHINPGFEAQLSLYQELGCRLPGEVTTPGRGNVHASATYRWFLLACGLKNNKYSAHLSGTNKETRFTADIRNGEEADACGSEHNGKPGLVKKITNGPFFRCKSCSHPLFSECNIIDHLHPLVRTVSDSTYDSFSRHGDGSSWLAARDAASANRAKQKASSQRRLHNGGTGRGKRRFEGPVSAMPTGHCTSVFTEPLEWMRGFSGGNFERVGKITCPGIKASRTVCGGKLGAWSLDGIDCSCGTTVKPAVQFILSRIERK